VDEIQKPVLRTRKEVAKGQSIADGAGLSLGGPLGWAEKSCPWVGRKTASPPSALAFAAGAVSDSAEAAPAVPASQITSEVVGSHRCEASGVELEPDPEPC